MVSKLLAAIATAGLVVPVQAGVLDGVAVISDSGASNPAQLKFPGILASQRGLNFGGPSLSYNYAFLGANTGNITTGGAIANVVSQVQAHNVTLTLMMVGDNDVFPVAIGIAQDRLPAQVRLDYFDSVVARIKVAVDPILAAGGRVILGSVSDIALAPEAELLVADPAAKTRLENACLELSDKMRDYAVSANVPFINFCAIEKSIFDTGHVEVGGVPIKLDGYSPDPHNFFQSPLNAGTIVRAEIGNLFLAAMNAAYDTDIPLLSDYEVLTLVGLQHEYTRETFLPNANFAAFITVPEPGSIVLASMGIVALGVTARARGWRIGRGYRL